MIIIKTIDYYQYFRYIYYTKIKIKMFY